MIRFVTILVGVLAAFIVNLVFLPPKYEVKLFRKIYILQDDIIRWTRLAVRQASEHTSTKTALSKFKTVYYEWIRCMISIRKSVIILKIKICKSSQTSSLSSNDFNFKEKFGIATAFA